MPGQHCSAWASSTAIDHHIIPLGPSQTARARRHARAPRCGARRGRGGVRARARARAPRVLGGWRHRLVAPAGCAHARVGTLAPLVCGVTVLAVPAVPAVPASPRWLHRGFAGSVVPPPSDPSPPPPADRLPARSVPASPAPWSFADVATVPNSLSVARGLAGPALACAVLHDAHPAFVLAGVFAAAVSDWLDGHLARRWNQRSVAGTYLDPAGDKIFVASLAIALAVRGDVPAWLAACLVGRDAALVVASLYQRARALEWRWNTWAEFAGVADDNRARAGFRRSSRRCSGRSARRGSSRSSEVCWRIRRSGGPRRR